METENAQRSNRTPAAARLLIGGVVAAGVVAAAFFRPWESSAEHTQPQQRGETIMQSEGSAHQLMTTLSIPIDGMSCSACAASIKRSTKAIDGVKDVEVDLIGRRAKVVYESKRTSPEQISAVIGGLGYKVGAAVVESDK